MNLCSQPYVFALNCANLFSILMDNVNSWYCRFLVHNFLSCGKNWCLRFFLQNVCAVSQCESQILQLSPTIQSTIWKNMEMNWKVKTEKWKLNWTNPKEQLFMIWIICIPGAPKRTIHFWKAMINLPLDSFGRFMTYSLAKILN